MMEGLLAQRISGLKALQWARFVGTEREKDEENFLSWKRRYVGSSRYSSLVKSKLGIPVIYFTEIAKGKSGQSFKCLTPIYVHFSLFQTHNK